MNPDAYQDAYSVMTESAKQNLRSGKSVALDATFDNRRARQRAIDSAHDVGAHMWVIGRVALRAVRQQHLTGDGSYSHSKKIHGSR